MKKHILSLLILTFFAFGSEDYSYKPYPVLLVHGFGNGPWAMGVNTNKKEDAEEFPDNHVGNILHLYFNDVRKS